MERRPRCEDEAEEPPLYPQSNAGSDGEKEIGSPAIHLRLIGTPASAGSSPSEPPSFIEGGQRLRWNSSTPGSASRAGANEASPSLRDRSRSPQDESPQGQQPPFLGAAFAAAASLAASVSGGDPEVPAGWESGGNECSLGEVQIRTAMSNSRGCDSVAFDDGDYSLNQVPESPTTYNFDQPPGMEQSIGEAYVMTYDDYTHWPMMGNTRGRNMPDGGQARAFMGMEQEAEPSGQGPNSRACDEVLRPFGGQPYVVRGAEALRDQALRDQAEACRLQMESEAQASLEAQRMSSFGSSCSSGAADRPQALDGSGQNGGSCNAVEDSGDLSSDSPTSAELRHGLGVLQALSSELEEERRSRNQCGSQGRGGARELQELRQELQQGIAERQELQARISHSENVERHYAATVTELRTELHLERSRLQAEIEMAETAERSAVAAAEREAALVDSFRDEFTHELQAAALVEARAGISAETERLSAALAVATAQEAAVAAVAADLRGELLQSERCVSELQDSAQQGAFSAAAAVASVARLEAEKMELTAALDSAQRAEAKEIADAAQLRVMCSGLQRELSSAAEVARQGLPAAIQDSAALLDVARREHELSLALTAAEHQRQLDNAKLEGEKQQLQTQVEFLGRELEHERQGSAKQQQRLCDAESDTLSLREENRRLQTELFSELSAAASSAAEARVAAAAAFEERSRLRPLAMLDSPASNPGIVRRLLQDSDSGAATPCMLTSSRGLAETPVTSGTVASLLQRRMRLNVAGGSGASSVFQDRLTPARGGTPQRALSAGDAAAGGSAQRAAAESKHSEETEANALALLLTPSLKDAEIAEEEHRGGRSFSPSQKPFRGGRLALARAQAMCTGSSRSKSPDKRQ